MTNDHEKPYLTRNNFRTRFNETDKDFVMLSGYLWAVSTLMPVLKEITEKAQSFDDLKKEILNFVNQNLELNEHIENSKENDSENYGFPTRLGPI